MADATHFGFYFSWELWMAAGVSAVLVIGSVLFHYEMFRVFSRGMATLPGAPRVHILYLVLALTAVQIVEIWLFAFGYYFLASTGAGQIHGMEVDVMFEYVYFSATVYSTLGFGDLVPAGMLRLLTGIEGLVGLGLITWSAAFTFLQMQRYWRP